VAAGDGEIADVDLAVEGAAEDTEVPQLVDGPCVGALELTQAPAELGAVCQGPRYDLNLSTARSMVSKMSKALSRRSSLKISAG
jgi:hypothetical protein